MDEELKSLRSPLEERLFYRKLRMCVGLAREIGETPEERANILLECYHEVTGEERKALRGNKGVRKRRRGSEEQ